jgi:tetratricopeptide (TPR) repeat protein
LKEDSRRDAAAAAAIGAGALAAFGMTIQAPVFFDDLPFVAQNPLFAKPASAVLAAVSGPGYFAATGERSWQPLVTLLNWTMASNPAAWRLTGIALHAAAALLVRVLARRVSRSELAGWLAAFLFLFFPLSTETVFFAAFRGHQLAALSALAGLLLWQDGRRKASAAALALGLLAKETALAGPLLIVLHEAVFRRAELRARLRGLSGHAAVAAAYLVWRFGVLVPAPAQVSQAARMPLASLGWYLGALVAPWPACLFRTLSSGAALWLLPYAAAVWAARKSKSALFGLLWIPVALLPFLHLMAFAFYSPVADRYLYLAAAGAAVALASLLAETRFRLAAVVLAAVWGAGTILRNGQFRDLPLVGELCVECAPLHPQAHAMSGQLRMAYGDYSNARRRFERAVELAPGDPQFHDSLGLSLYATGYKKEAVEQFRLAADLGPGARPWNNLGAALDALGRKKEALAAYDEAIRRDPEWAKPRESAAEIRARP